MAARRLAHSVSSDDVTQMKSFEKPRAPQMRPAVRNWRPLAPMMNLTSWYSSYLYRQK